MAQTSQAQKRIRQNARRRLLNMSMRSRMRTMIKKVRAAIESKDYKVSTDAFKALVPVLDSYAGKGIVHKNKAARLKSRLNAQIKVLAGKSA